MNLFELRHLISSIKQHLIEGATHVDEELLAYYVEMERKMVDELSVEIGALLS